MHPALQANLADAFINGLHDTSYSLDSSTSSTVSYINNDESIKRLSVASPIQFVIETHSEHFLLRLLKRIRQTSARQPLPDELKLTPDDISIFYFNPHIDGDTSIHHIRVSEDGDFLDRWPHGFFPERDQELFDE